MVDVYVKLVRAGMRKIEEVPEGLRAAVEKALEGRATPGLGAEIRERSERMNAVPTAHPKGGSWASKEKGRLICRP